MENELSWPERHITTRNPAYKRFVKELESNPEEFFKKGLTNRQERFLKIYDALNFEKTKDDYQFNVVVKFNNKAELFLSFENNTKAVSYIEKSDFAEKKSYLFRDIPNEFEVSISNAADKEKFLSDVWAKELEKRTGLSSGLTVTQIDERQAFHYRNYETEAKKSGIELTRFLPKQLSAAEVEQVIQEVIISVGATGKADMGKVMGAVMPKLKGKADGKLINQTVAKLLN